MNLADQQKRIDALTWYHDFDFGNGLKAVSQQADRFHHRPLWEFMQAGLNEIDFQGKTVLDLGCWDGYWSFFAEKRGAAAVLATDDQSQNWMGSQGLLLAKELLDSKVEVDLKRSVYKLEELNRKFDVILFLGVYYHLFDPYYALTQIRHCCHENTLVVIDGPIGIALPENAGLFRFAHHACEVLPTHGMLRQLVEAAYLKEVESKIFVDPKDAAEREHQRTAKEPVPLGWRWRLSAARKVLSGDRALISAKVDEVIKKSVMPPQSHDRILMKCRPFVGTSELHQYAPPFGLEKYDDRFRSQG
jgi:tRNA (mo5U34)-methyltransferase